LRRRRERLPGLDRKQIGPGRSLLLFTLRCRTYCKEVVMKIAQCILFKCPTVARSNFRRLLLALVILCLALPRLAAGQPLNIITDPYPPYGYVKDGEIVGCTVDLIKLLLKRTGIDGKFIMYPWARAYKMAQKEKDILIYQLAYSKERDHLFQLVGPIYHSADYFWKLKSRKDIALKNLEDARQFRVGTVREYFTHKYLLEKGFEEGKNLEAVPDDDMNVKKLASGRIDLMLLDEMVFNYRVEALGYNRDDFEKAFVLITTYSYLGFSRQTSTNVVSRFAEALEVIKKDGSYNRILLKYGVHSHSMKGDLK
jgi:polar amino acid transport system substrate-binding protein